MFARPPRVTRQANSIGGYESLTLIWNEQTRDDNNGAAIVWRCLQRLGYVN